ncbi:MAG: hypothetical protein ABIP02_07215, partial [Arenimonas sp.]
QEELESQFRSNNGVGITRQPQSDEPIALKHRTAIPVSVTEVAYDLRQEISGTNWHYAESDGRWAGFDISSELKLPSMKSGHYELTLDIVDAIEQEIFQEMTVFLNGTRLELDFEKNMPPAMVSAEFEIDDTFEEPVWTFSFNFPKVVSPAEKAQDMNDLRKLSVRMRALKLRMLD